MKILQFIISMFCALHMAVAIGDVGHTTKTQTATTVYVTTRVRGQLTTMPTVFEQSFLTTYSTPTDDVSSGNVGLGTHTQTLGRVRSYAQTTISSNKAQEANAGTVAYGSVIGIAFLVAGMLL